MAYCGMKLVLSWLPRLLLNMPLSSIKGSIVFWNCVVMRRNCRVSNLHRGVMRITNFLKLLCRASNRFISILCRSALERLTAHTWNLNWIDVLKLLAHKVAFPIQIRGQWEIRRSFAKLSHYCRVIVSGIVTDYAGSDALNAALYLRARV